MCEPFHNVSRMHGVISLPDATPYVKYAQIYLQCCTKVTKSSLKVDILRVLNSSHFMIVLSMN